MLVVLMFLLVTGIQAQTVTPSKKYITKELNNVSNFSSIRVLGSPDVEYRQSNGSKTTVSIYGSDNLVDLLEVSTVNGVLQILRFDISGTGYIQIQVIPFDCTFQIYICRTFNIYLIQ